MNPITIIFVGWLIGIWPAGLWIYRTILKEVDMSKGTRKLEQKRYNLKEFKDTFLPNRDIESLENPEPRITREKDEYSAR